MMWPLVVALSCWQQWMVMVKVMTMLEPCRQPHHRRRLAPRVCESAVELVQGLEQEQEQGLRLELERGVSGCCPCANTLATCM